MFSWRDYKGKLSVSAGEIRGVYEQVRVRTGRSTGTESHGNYTLAEALWDVNFSTSLFTADYS